MDTSSQRPSTSGQTYRNLALTAVAVLLGANLLQQAGAPMVTQAGAQVRQPVTNGSPQNTVTRGSEAPTSHDDTGGALVSAAEQRKEMISELSGLSRRLDRIEIALKQPLNVKVLSMPAQSGGDKNGTQNQPQGTSPTGTPAAQAPAPAASPAISLRGSN